MVMQIKTVQKGELGCNMICQIVYPPHVINPPKDGGLGQLIYLFIFLRIPNISTEEWLLHVLSNY